MSRGVSNLLGYAKAGTDFIFGPLASPEMGANSFAIAALPVIIFFACLISILYYLGIMQLIIKWVGGAIRLVTGHHPRGIAGLGGEHLRRPVGKPAGDQALSRQSHALRSSSAS